MLEGVRKLLAELSRKSSSDSLARKSAQQLIATAIKHGAERVIISALECSTRVDFVFEAGEKSEILLPVNIDSLLGVLFAASDIIEQQDGNLRAAVRMNFRNLRVDAQAMLMRAKGTESDNLPGRVQFLQHFNSVELSSFEVGFPLADEKQETPSASAPSLPVVGDRVDVISDGDVVFRNRKDPSFSGVRSKPAQTPELELSPAEPSLAKAHETLLLIEDDADQRAILRRVFEREGYIVEVAEDGMDGLVTASRVIPDLVIVDFMMPEMDGGETIRRLRANPLTAKIPVVVLTAYPSTEVEFGMLQAGADDFCPKSISKKVLLKRIERLIRE